MPGRQSWLRPAASPHLERRVLEYITANRVMFGQDDPYGGSTGQAGADSRGRFGGSNGARAFVETAPIGAQDKAKLAYLNAERLLLRRTA
jgi:predicted TIM-barrel fold metal-dependent hydrolase